MRSNDLLSFFTFEKRREGKKKALLDLNPKRYRYETLK